MKYTAPIPLKGKPTHRDNNVGNNKTHAFCLYIHEIVRIVFGN